MKPNHKVEVFSDGVSAKASDLLHQVALEDAKGSGNDRQHVKAGPGFASYQECAQVLNHLQHLNRFLREAHFFQLAVGHRAVVQDAHNPPHGNDPAGIGENAGHDAHERFLFEDRVGVDYTDVRAGSRVEAGIDCVGLTASRLLVQNQQLGFGRTAVDSAQWRGRNVWNVENPSRLKLKRQLQFFQGTVARSVVDHNDFQGGIVEAQQSPDTFDDAALLIVSRDQQRDRRSKRRSLKQFKFQTGQAVTVDRVLEDGGNQQDQVDEIGQQVVNKECVIGNRQE